MTDEERQQLITSLRNYQNRQAVEYWKREAALAQSDAEQRSEIIHLTSALREAESRIEALAQSDVEPQETWNKQLPGPDSILHELGECPTQSDAEPNSAQVTDAMIEAACRTFLKLTRPNDDPDKRIKGAYHNLSGTTFAVWETYRPYIKPALEAALAQSDAEPVDDGSLHDSIIENYRMGIRPIGLIDEYFGFPSMTAPPRPDASAGLIEAAEWHEAEAPKFGLVWAEWHREAARKLRARAADRSGK